MVDTTKKAAYANELKGKFERAKVMVLADFSGVTVEQINKLRREIRNGGDEIRVVKNTLARRAAKAMGQEQLVPHFEGPTAVTLGYGDPVAPVKALVKFAGECEKFKFKVGVLEGKLLQKEELKALSELPGREQLLSMLLSCMQGPIRNLVSVLAGPIRKFGYALQAIKDKKEKSGAAA
jgi:large subunit ribosomal protein L10